MHVILTAEKHRRVAEVTLKFRDHTLVGVEESGDARISLNGALDKLERQAVRLLERKRTRKRRPKPATTVVLNVLGPERIDHEERRTIEAERVPIKPMTHRRSDLRSRPVARRRCGISQSRDRACERHLPPARWQPGIDRTRTLKRQ